MSRIAVVTVVVAALGLAACNGSASRTQEKQSAPETTVSTPTKPPPPYIGPHLVTVTLDIQPPDAAAKAQILMDGRPLANPLRIADSMETVVDVVAEGYVPYEAHLRADKNTTITVTLKKK